jgi:hypothetical protein
MDADEKNRDYDPHGPCGPNAFWKISNLDDKSDERSVGQTDFLSLVDNVDDIHVDGQDWTSEDDDEDDDWGVDDPDEEGASEMELEVEILEMDSETEMDTDGETTGGDGGEGSDVDAEVWHGFAE